MKREIADCDALLVRMDRVTPALIDAAPRLRIIARHGVGTDNIDVGYAAKKGIWVATAALSNYNAVAEHTVMLMLCCAKRVRWMHGRSTEADYQEAQRSRGSELAGKTLGVIGLGRVGRRVSQIAHGGFGMKILAYDPMAKDGGEDWIRLCESREELLEHSDFVTLHLPLTEETRGGIGGAELARMKRSAFLINAAREELVDRGALCRALREKSIAGAAIDFVERSEGEAAELLALPNVLVTPHSAALTEEAMHSMAMQAAEEIDRVLSGGKPRWPVCRPQT